MISNCKSTNFDIIEITNELPTNRLGGVGSVIENLKSGFQKLGVRALWFLVDHSYKNDEIYYIQNNYKNVVIGSYKDLKKFNAPVAHLHTYNSNPEIFHYLKDKKVIYTIHSLLICEAISNDIDLTPSIQQQERMISACDKIVLVSNAEKEWYYKYNYHKLNSNIHVIHNGLKQVNNYRQLISNKKTIGYCGRLVPRKRPEYVHLLLGEKDFVNCKVMIAGRGFSPFAKNIVEQNNLHNRVIYLGWCGGARLEAFYNSIDVLAITSIYEPFGMVALEAIARGIPVVCNRIGGLGEILENNAIFYEEESYKSFHNAMLKWLKTDSEQIQVKTRKAYTRYCNYFTDIEMTKNYLKLVEDIVLV